MVSGDSTELSESKGVRSYHYSNWTPERNIDFVRNSTPIAPYMPLVAVVTI